MGHCTEQGTLVFDGELFHLFAREYEVIWRPTNLWFQWASVGY